MNLQQKTHCCAVQFIMMMNLQSQSWLLRQHSSPPSTPDVVDAAVIPAPERRASVPIQQLSTDQNIVQQVGTWNTFVRL